MLRQVRYAALGGILALSLGTVVALAITGLSLSALFVLALAQYPFRLLLRVWRDLLHVEGQLLDSSTASTVDHASALLWFGIVLVVLVDLVLVVGIVDVLGLEPG